MKRSAITRVPMTDLNPEAALSLAFRGALRKFEKNHDRQPDFDSLNISGGFCTTSLYLEITEDPWND